jgi:hypothetical protein
VRARLLLAFSLTLSGCGKVVGDLPFDASLSPDAPIGGGADARAIDARPSLADAGPQFPANSIRALRFDPPQNGSTVMLRNVVLVAKLFLDDRAVLFVQDRGIAGPLSGIQLNCGATGGCPHTRAEIEALNLGEVLDVDGTLAILTPPGARPQARVLVTDIDRTGMNATVQSFDVDPTLVAADRHDADAVQPLLQTYVRLAPGGGLTLSDVRATPFMGMCDNPLDAGTPDVAYRGVLATAGARVVAIGMIAIGALRDYCVSQCEVACGAEMMAGDRLDGVAGILDVFARQGQTPVLTINPTQSRDLMRSP